MLNVGYFTVMTIHSRESQKWAACNCNLFIVHPVDAIFLNKLFGITFDNGKWHVICQAHTRALSYPLRHGRSAFDLVEQATIAGGGWNFSW